ncbi:hypothetical protein A7J67_08835 [Achromobacter xylosoxidans]|nr:hypothetical protein A7J67_08835 [Achromobacter xylosoxidans]
MKKSKSFEEQISFALKHAEPGTAVPDSSTKLGADETTSCESNENFEDLGSSDLGRHRQVEEECICLNRLIAELSRAKALLQDILAEMR